jgi:hypothetical protein
VHKELRDLYLLDGFRMAYYVNNTSSKASITKLEYLHREQFIYGTVLSGEDDENEKPPSG